jgi:hypothetical protein
MAYVAPATAKSTVLALVSIEMDVTNMLVASTISISLAVRLTIKLQMMTGARRRNTTNGARMIRAAWVVQDRGRT